MRQLARRLALSEQEERHRIAQILHDDLQQLLFGVDMKMMMIRRDLAETNGELGVSEDLHAVGEWIQEAISMTRQLSVDLSPPVLKSEGLADALEWVQTQMREMHDLEVEVEAEQSFVLEDDLRVLLFQTVRELLFNVKKHAEVDHATVRLEDEDGHLVIHVMDSGRGFDAREVLAATSAEGGFGLANVRERLEFVGGRLEISSSPGEGTHVKVHAPPPDEA